MSMREMTTTSKNSIAAAAAATNMSGRQFEMLKIEFSANLRELAKEVIAQTRGNYEQIETASNETMRVLVSTQSAAAKSIVNYPDVIEYSSAHVRIQFDALAAQTKELTDLAHNIATQMAEPIKTSITGAGENVT
jgi:hypothetical protein